MKTATPSHRWRAIRLIAIREVKERTRSRIYRLTLLITSLLVVVAVVAPALAQDRQSTPIIGVGVVQPTSDELISGISHLAPTLGAIVTVREYPNVEQGEAALRKDDISLLVVPSKELVTRVGFNPNLDSPQSRLAAAVGDLARLYAGLAAVGVSPAQTSHALSQAPLPVRGLEEAPHRDDKDATAAGASMVLLFVLLNLYGAFILNGVTEEKASRVVEILLSTVRPNELLTGKVLGIAIVGSFQAVVLLVATLVARAAITSVGATSLSAPLLGYTFLWLMLGLGVYAWLYAAAGALVTRSEDAQSLVFPLQMPLFLSYFVGLIASINGPSTLLVVMSMIPFTAPMTMLERMAAQQVPPWQIALSITFCIITIFIVRRIAIAIFSGGILRTGQKVKVRDALKAV